MSRVDCISVLGLVRGFSQVVRAPVSVSLISLDQHRTERDSDSFLVSYTASTLSRASWLCRRGTLYVLCVHQRGCRRSEPSSGCVLLCSHAAHGSPRGDFGDLPGPDCLPEVGGRNGAIGRGPATGRAHVDVAGQSESCRGVPATLRVSLLLGARRAAKTRRPPSARSG